MKSKEIAITAQAPWRDRGGPRVGQIMSPAEVGEPIDEAIQVTAAVALGDSDEELRAERGVDSAKIEARNDIAPFERPDHSAGVAASDRDHELVERRRGEGQRIAG